MLQLAAIVTVASDTVLKSNIQNKYSKVGPVLCCLVWRRFTWCSCAFCTCTGILSLRLAGAAALASSNTYHGPCRNCSFLQ